MAKGALRVTEVSAGGSVPELLVENRLDKPVLCLDGEELVGAKQNRILNVTVMVAPQSTTKIPVSCVEQGRWSWASEDFSAADRVLYSRGRARKNVDVTASMDMCAERGDPVVKCSDQGAVWSDVSEKLSRLHAHSATGAISDGYRSHAGRVERYVDAFPVCERQVGAVYALNGRVAGLELFDHGETYSRCHKKILRSYAFDAIEYESDAAPQSDETAHAFLELVALTEFKEFEGTGLGQDIRFMSDDVAGGGLRVGNRLMSPGGLCPREARAAAEPWVAIHCLICSLGPTGMSAPGGFREALTRC